VALFARKVFGHVIDIKLAVELKRLADSQAGLGGVGYGIQ